MKRILLYITLLFTTLAFSQKEASVWYFGNNAGLKFNDDGSLTALTDGKLATIEGCSSIADTEGNLLFYTNGVTVWNKEHGIMENGTELKGNSSTTQTLIVPNPNFSNIYYIFTLDDFAGPDGLCYSEVDLNYNSGLGKITSNKNIQLATPTCEKVCAVKNASDDGYWVVAHGYGNNTFLAYSVTSLGINLQPVISNAGKIIDVTDNGATTSGYMKFSPSGKKLISCNTISYNVELYDFDLSSGLVTNPRIISKKRFNYGVEFSPSEDIAYISATTDIPPYYLCQYDLTASSIPDSEVILYRNYFMQLKALQMGINGKIYGSIVDSKTLISINNPNILGTGCGFQLNGSPLLSGNCTYGLPQFVQSYFRAKIDVKKNCLGSTTSFSLNTLQTIDNISWDFGDGSTSNSINAIHQYVAAGNYLVKALVKFSDGEPIVVSRNITIYEASVANKPQNLYLCDNDKNEGKGQFDLSIQTPEILGNQVSSDYSISYHQSQNEADFNKNAITNISTFSNTINPQTIFVRVENSQFTDCFATTNFQLIVNQNPILIMDDTYTICTGEEINVSAPSGFSAYLWSDGSTGDTIKISKAGNYSVTVFKDYQTTTCNTKKDFTVYNSSVATITKIDTSQSSITVWASGEGKYEYSIDGMNYQDDPVFNNLTGSDYTIYVRDKNGCGTVTEEVVLLMYPEFFTPNGDGHNDNWGVNLLYLKQGSEAYIFDRFGKLITILSSQKTEWDGTYNGNSLPSDDYWFILKTQNGKEYRGHFSLKR